MAHPDIKAIALLKAPPLNTVKILKVLFVFIIYIINTHIYMSILSTCVYMYHVCAWCLQMPERDIGSPKTGVTDSYGYLGQNPGPLEEHRVCLTTELSL